MTKSAKDQSGGGLDLFGQLSRPVSNASPAKTSSAKRTSTQVRSTDQFATKFFTVNEVAERYQVNVSTIWRWVKEGKGFPKPGHLTSGTSRWLDIELFEYERVVFANSKSGEKLGSRPSPSAGVKGPRA